MIDMSRGELHPELFPAEAVKRAVLSAHGTQSHRALFSYGEETRGYTGLIDQIKTLKDGFADFDTQDFIITHGATHALDLVFGTLVAGADDVVVVERPSYKWALENIDRRGGTIRSIPIDEHGMDIGELERMLDADPDLRSQVRAVYTMPNAQNPSGVSMSARRRRRLMELAASMRFHVLEDDPYWGYGDPTGGLVEYDVGNRLIHVGSFSKTVAPGIRLGWIASRTDVPGLIHSWFPNAANPYLSRMLSEMIDLDDFHYHIERCKKIVDAKRHRIVDLLRTQCPSLSFLAPRGGFYVFCQLPPGFSEQEFVDGCRADGLAVMAGSGFVRGTAADTGHIRLCFAGARDSEIERGIAILADQLIRVAA